MAHYIEITRSDTGISYIETVDKAKNAFYGEVIDLVDQMDPGDSVSFTIVEMTPEEYAATPEFTGW